MSDSITMTVEVHRGRGAHGRVELREGGPPDSAAPERRVPWIARLMALAIRFEALIAADEVRDHAHLAGLGRVTRARVSQIMSLLHLAPDLQEQLLFLPPTGRGREPVGEHHLRPITAAFDWREQRRLWRRVVADATIAASEKTPERSGAGSE